MADGDHGDVRTFAMDATAAERDRVRLVRYFLACRQCRGRREEGNGIVVSDRRDKETVCVRRCGGKNRLHSRVDEERIWMIRVLSCEAETRSRPGHEIHDRHPRLTPRHQPELLCLVRDLLEREVEERGDLVLDHRAATGKRGTGREAREHLLRDRHVQHAIVTELLGEALRHASQRCANVLAEDEDARIPQHLVAQCLPERLLVAHPGHGATPSRGRSPLA